MARPGPIGKTDAERIRRNKPDTDQTRLTDISGDYTPPPPDGSWHPVALNLYEAIRTSAQTALYQPSDFALAYMLAESLSRELKPRWVGSNAFTGEDVIRKVPIAGASLNAYLKGLNDLLSSVTARKRARIEVDKPVEHEPVELVDLDAARASRLG